MSTVAEFEKNLDFLWNSYRVEPQKIYIAQPHPKMRRKIGRYVRRMLRHGFFEPSVPSLEYWHALCVARSKGYTLEASK